MYPNLTCNSKRVIDKFSKLAWDNETQADEIVEVMETHLRQVDETTRKYMSEVRKTWFQHVFGRNMHDSDVTVDNNDHERVLSTIPQTSEEPGTGGDTTDLNTQLAASQIEPSMKVYSPELVDLEKKLISSIANSGRNSYNYLLLDPMITKNLPSRMNSLGDEKSFKDFVAAIFYVGKGQGTRSYSHLRDAFKQMKIKGKKKEKTSLSKKIKCIHKIWGKGKGVVILDCFPNVISEEALTREACMISAIGLDQLTNMRNGSYYDISKEWTMVQKRNMGIYFLEKALQKFKEEGETQICRSDIG